jgi:hypothetical protein
MPGSASRDLSERHIIKSPVFPLLTISVSPRRRLHPPIMSDLKVAGFKVRWRRAYDGD